MPSPYLRIVRNAKRGVLQNDKSLSFDIPTELSPVKDTGGQPRAMSALGKNISSIMGKFPGRR